MCISLHSMCATMHVWCIKHCGDRCGISIWAVPDVTRTIMYVAGTALLAGEYGSSMHSRYRVRVTHEAKDEDR